MAERIMILILKVHPVSFIICSSFMYNRMILESELMHELEEPNYGDDVAISGDDEAETENLLHFLISVKEEKQKQATKLAEELSFLDEDFKEVERSYSFGTDSVFPMAQINYPSSSDISRSIPRSCNNEARFMSNITQLENSYFSMRFQVLLKEASAVASYDKDVMESRWILPHIENVNKEPRRIQSSVGCLGSFFEGLCKFACYSKFEELGTLRNRDLLNSANVICALSFDRDEDYIAVGGVSKKIKIFDLSTILSGSIDIQYPIVEMSNKSKLSCVCWNSYIKNHLASTDYDGVVQVCNPCNIKTVLDESQFWSCSFIYTNKTIIASVVDYILCFIDINYKTCMDEFRCGMQTLVSHCLNIWSTKRELGLFTFLCPTQKCLLVEVMTALSNCGISARQAFFYAFK